MNYGNCLQCGFCAQGCIYNKKHALWHTHILRAERTGVEFRAGCDVRTNERRGVVWAVNYPDGEETKTVIADVVFVAGGGLHTPALLLCSRAAGLRLESEHVGEHFNHNGELQFFGELPADLDEFDRCKCYVGMDNEGLMSRHWFESDDFAVTSRMAKIRSRVQSRWQRTATTPERSDSIRGCRLFAMLWLRSPQRRSRSRPPTHQRRRGGW